MSTEKASGQEQYEAWGVSVRTSNVRAGHLANGLMQLLRLLPEAPDWRCIPEGELVAQYPGLVKKALKARAAGAPWGLSEVARALCVTKSKRGEVSLGSPAGGPKYLKAGAQLVKERLVVVGEEGITRAMHRRIASVLNADERVMDSGGSDPTTPGLTFVGYTDPHTLSGFHAVTFLGLLSATERGCAALARLYRVARKGDDPHSTLACYLGLGIDSHGPAELLADGLRDVFPRPAGEAWASWAEVAGEMTNNLLAWAQRGASKGETLMSVVDLAILLHLIRMLRWRRPESGVAPRALLLIGTPSSGAGMQQAIGKAQQSLQSAAATLDEDAKGAGLVLRTKNKKEKEKVYYPGAHALSLGGAGGWLFPMDSRGGAKRYLRPGARQLITLVHALVSPGEQVSWPELAERAERLGLVLGGHNEHAAELRLGIGGVAATLRDVGRQTREQLVALGLARRESDNVVMIDGGLA